MPAYLNRIGTAVPANEVHGFFRRFVSARLAGDPRRRALFERMSERSGIARRFSVIVPAEDPEGEVVDRAGRFRVGAFPGTGERMAMFEAHAPALAERAIAALGLGGDTRRITHLVVTSCTGFSAPGIDLEIVARCGLDPSVERTMIGFMGCYAAINGLKTARHIVRSEPDARVLVVAVELTTLHLKETLDLEQLLTFTLWGDGCAAALVTADEEGFRLDGFRALLASDARELMSWHVRDDGFDMVLSGRVPGAVSQILGTKAAEILAGTAKERIDLWAVHPGGKSVLDAAERALDLPPAALDASRAVLREHGNMSSATVLFVLGRMLREGGAAGREGSAMAFGPGLVAETMRFSAAG